MAVSEPIRDSAKLRQLAEHFLKQGQLRNYTLIILGVHTALRISEAYVKQKLKICENIFYHRDFKTAPIKSKVRFCC
jgi:hypothetical protein